MRIEKSELIRLAAQYDARAGNTPDSSVENQLRSWFSKHRHLDKSTFLALRNWKSNRGVKFAAQNSPEVIEEITHFALTAKTEEARVEILRTLKGVDYPVASAILHFAFPDQYSIIDFRAIDSLEWEPPKHNQYDFAYWMKYTSKIRGIAAQTGLPIRTIDKALWEYSKQKGPRNQI